MPANLTPQYLDAEARYRAARTPEEQLAALEAEFKGEVAAAETAADPLGETLETMPLASACRKHCEPTLPALTKPAGIPTTALV